MIHCLLVWAKMIHFFLAKVYFRQTGDCLFAHLYHFVPLYFCFFSNKYPKKKSLQPRLIMNRTPENIPVYKKGLIIIHNWYISNRYSKIKFVLYLSVFFHSEYLLSVPVIWNLNGQLHYIFI